MTTVDRSKPIVYHSEKPEDAESEFFYTLIYNRYEITSDDGEKFYTVHTVPLLIEVESESKHFNRMNTADITAEIPIVREFLKKSTSYVTHCESSYSERHATCEDAIVFRVRETKDGFEVVKEPSDDEIREFRRRYSVHDD